MSAEPNQWVHVHHPLQDGDLIPSERRIVLVWLATKYLPYCGYIRFAAGDKDSPFFVVYHGNSDIGADVIAWMDIGVIVSPDWGQSRSVIQTVTNSAEVMK